MPIKSEFVSGKIAPAKKAPRKKAAKKSAPKKLAKLTADELLEHKVRQIMFSSQRDAFALWARHIKTKYGIDSSAMLDIHPASGQLRIRTQTLEEVKTDG